MLADSGNGSSNNYSFASNSYKVYCCINQRIPGNCEVHRYFSVLSEKLINASVFPSVGWGQGYILLDCEEIK